MRIALLAPVSHRLPPAGYGPWETVVGNLAEGLAAAGHEVTAFAAGGSQPCGRLIAVVPHPLQEWPPGGDRPDPRVWEEIHIAEMARLASEGSFDVVHSHLNVHPLGYAGLLPVPLVTTLHGAAWNRKIHPALARFRHLPFLSLSDAERAFKPDLNYVATVHNGIRKADFPHGDGGGGYLLYAGRLAPEKAPHLAVEVAQRAGRRLKLAGMIESIHQDYFDSRIAPAVNDGAVEYVGVVDRQAMSALYRGAAATIMPLAWDEPFGLVVVESLMSGTPVIAWRRGAMPELIVHGVTGALVDDVAAAAAAVADLDRIDRQACRDDALKRFTVETMAAKHLAVYEALIRDQAGTISSSSSSIESVTIPTPRSENP